MAPSSPQLLSFREGHGVQRPVVTKGQRAPDPRLRHKGATGKRQDPRQGIGPKDNGKWVEEGTASRSSPAQPDPRGSALNPRLGMQGRPWEQGRVTRSSELFHQSTSLV